MGADGGTIPTRIELVKTKKKPEEVILQFSSFSNLFSFHVKKNRVKIFQILITLLKFIVSKQCWIFTIFLQKDKDSVRLYKCTLIVLVL